MNIEEQVTSLELSKQIKELGVEQESLFYWISTLQGFEIVYQGELLGEVSYSAFTVAELGKLLPTWFYSGKTLSKALKTEFECGSAEYDKQTWKKADTEANARGKMLIYLIEHNLIETHAKH